MSLNNEIEVELIENYKPEFSQLAEISEVEVVVQQIIVNNEIQNITGHAFVISCPKCGRVLYQFPYGVSEVEAHLARNQGGKELLKIATHCPSCGVKLDYGPKEIINY